MRLLWRCWLVWLMVLALPLQGMAGTAMQHCADRAGLAERGGQPPAAADAHHEPGPRLGHQASVAAADAGHHHAAAVEPSGSALSGTQPASTPGGDHHCSACAACCAALGLPSRVVPLAPPRVVAAAAALPLLAVDSFVPAGLERPPRPQAA